MSSLALEDPGLLKSRCYIDGQWVDAGSGVDVIVRSAPVALSKTLGGQPVVIENLPGAGGITGTQTLVKSANVTIAL